LFSFGVNRVAFTGISVFVRRLRNRCVGDVVMPAVGVLRWSSNASYGFKMVFADFLSNVLAIFTADSDFPLLW